MPARGMAGCVCWWFLASLAIAGKAEEQTPLNTGSDPARRLAAVESTIGVNNKSRRLLLDLYTNEPRRLAAPKPESDVRAAIVRRVSVWPLETRIPFLMQALGTEIAAATEDLSQGYTNSAAFRHNIEEICAALSLDANDTVAKAFSAFVDEPRQLKCNWLEVRLLATSLHMSDRAAGRNTADAVRLRAQSLTQRDLVAALSHSSAHKSDVTAVFGALCCLTDDFDQLAAWGVQRLRDEALAFEDRIGASLILGYALSLSPQGKEVPEAAHKRTEALPALVSFTGAHFADMPLEVRILAHQFLFAAVNRPQTPYKIVRSGTALLRLLQKDVDAFIQAQDARQHADPRKDARKETLARIAAVAGRAEQPFAEDQAFLFEATASGDYKVTSEAAKAIKMLRAKAQDEAAFAGVAERNMVRLLEQKPETQWLFTLCAEHFARMPDTRSRELLHRFMEPQTPLGKVNACLLVKAGRKEALLKETQPYLTDENTWVRRVAEETWESLGYETWQGKVVNHRGSSAPGKAGAQQAQPADTEQLPQPPSYDASALAALWRITPPPEFENDLNAAIEALKNGKDDVLSASCQRLAANEARGALLDIALDEEKPMLSRRAGLHALATNGTSVAVSAVLTAVRLTDDKKFQNAVSEAWARLKNVEAMPVLFAALGDGTDCALDAACAKAIGRMPGIEPTKALLNAYAVEDDDEIRDVLAEGIAAAEAPEAVSFLAAALKPWPDDRLARAVLTGLISIGTADAIKALFAPLEEKEVLGKREAIELVSKAIFMAAEYYQDKPELLAAVLGRLSAPTPEVRAAAAQGVSSLKKNETVLAAIKQAAANEKDEQVTQVINNTLELLTAPDKPVRPPAPPDKARGDF